MSKIINLTPHVIAIVDSDGKEIRTFEPSGMLARVSVKIEKIGEIDGISITQSKFSDIEGLPAPSKDTYYIVSSLVASRCPERNDVFIPNESVRDGKGRIIGCRSLGKISESERIEQLKKSCEEAWDQLNLYQMGYWNIV